jgi:hypothetical protein
MSKKKVKFGYIKGTYIQTVSGNSTEYIFEVKIVRETNDVYEILYGKNMIQDGVNSNFIRGLHKVVDKKRIYGIHERELNWIQRNLNNDYN